MITLSDRIAVYVPHTIAVNRNSDNSEYVQSAIKLLSLLCGGATAQNANGGWIDSNGELVTEKITIVYAYTDSLESVRDTVIKFAGYLKIALEQESVAVECNSILNLV